MIKQVGNKQECSGILQMKRFDEYEAMKLWHEAITFYNDILIMHADFLTQFTMYVHAVGWEKEYWTFNEVEINYIQ